MFRILWIIICFTLSNLFSFDFWPAKYSFAHLENGNPEVFLLLFFFNSEFKMYRISVLPLNLLTHCLTYMFNYKFCLLSDSPLEWKRWFSTLQEGNTLRFNPHTKSKDRPYIYQVYWPVGRTMCWLTLGLARDVGFGTGGRRGIFQFWRVDKFSPHSYRLASLALIYTSQQKLSTTRVLRNILNIRNILTYM